MALIPQLGTRKKFLEKLKNFLIVQKAVNEPILIEESPVEVANLFETVCSPSTTEQSSFSDCSSLSEISGEGEDSFCEG